MAVSRTAEFLEAYILADDDLQDIEGRYPGAIKVVEDLERGDLYLAILLGKDYRKHYHFRVEGDAELRFFCQPEMDCEIPPDLQDLARHRAAEILQALHRRHAKKREKQAERKRRQIENEQRRSR